LGDGTSRVVSGHEIIRGVIPASLMEETLLARITPEDFAAQSDRQDCRRRRDHE
jgi:hypothetical protein